jgi:hypothetical protein
MKYLALTASLGNTPVRGEATLRSRSPDLHVMPEGACSPQPELEAHLTASGVAAAQVDVSSVRLNDQVPVHAVVEVEGRG